jgi:hypothetical protein
MEIFLVLTVTALVLVVTLDTEQKRRALLCQQADAVKHN